MHNNGLLIIPISSTCFGQNNCPKHVALTGIINKPLLLHLVCCLYYLYFIIYFLRLAKHSQFIPLQNVVYLITLPFLVRKIFTFYINDVLLFKCPFPGPKGSSAFYSDLLANTLVIPFKRRIFKY